MGIPGRKPRGEAAWPRGLCPVCRSLQRVMISNGKIAKHGRSAAAPAGCAGSYERPLRRQPRDGGDGDGDGGTVVGLRAGEDVPSVRLRSALPPPPEAS